MPYQYTPYDEAYTIMDLVTFVILKIIHRGVHALRVSVFQFLVKLVIQI